MFWIKYVILVTIIKYIFLHIQYISLWRFSAQTADDCGPDRHQSSRLLVQIRPGVVCCLPETLKSLCCFIQYRPVLIQTGTNLLGSILTSHTCNKNSCYPSQLLNRVKKNQYLNHLILYRKIIIHNVQHWLAIKPLKQIENERNCTV